MQAVRAEVALATCFCDSHSARDMSSCCGVLNSLIDIVKVGSLKHGELLRLQQEVPPIRTEANGPL